MARNPQVLTGLFIGRREETETIYQLESQIAQSIRQEAIELSKLFSWTTPNKKPGDWDDLGYWDKGIPQALFSVLCHFDSLASEEAAKAYLLMKGYSVQSEVR